MTVGISEKCPIDEAIILRGRRIGSGLRDQFDSVVGRKRVRGEFVNHIDENPLRLVAFQRIVTHLNQVFPPTAVLDETTVLERGYF